MSEQVEQVEASGAITTSERHVFALYVDQLRGEAEAEAEALLKRLIWFQHDVEAAVKRISEDPNAAAFDVVRQLSQMVQELDSQAGEVDALRGTLRQARRWALLLPETEVHE